MKRKFLLVVCVLMVACVEMWADVDWTDKTSLITNPSFETDSPVSNATTNALNSATVTGWTVLPTTTVSNAQAAVVNKSSTLSVLSGSDGATTDSKYFYVRQNWNNTGNFGIQQVIAAGQPAGLYMLTCKIKTSSSTPGSTKWYLSIQEGDNEAKVSSQAGSAAEWLNYGVVLYKISATTTLTISAYMVAGASGNDQHYAMLLDDFELKYIGADDLGTLTSSNTLDMSGAIYNADIYNADKSAAPRGWTAFKHTTGNGNYTEGSGNTRLEGWNSGNLDLDYYQTITNLPVGLYTVTAAAQERAEVGRTEVYAYTDGQAKATGSVNSKTESDITTSALKVTNGTMNIGIQSTANDWITADNFRLTYYGNSVEAVATAGTFSSATSATSGTWYSVTTTKGYYDITASDAVTISYTQDATQDADDGSYSTMTFTEAGTQRVLLNAGTLYFKTDATKNITITSLGNDIQYYATELPGNGAMTAGQWYSFTIATAGYYDATASSDLSDIVYTTVGTTNKDNEGSITANFAATENLLSATTYYVKSTSNQNLTISQSENVDLTSSITNPSFEVWDDAGKDTFKGWTLIPPVYGRSGDGDMHRSGGFGGGDNNNYRFHLWTANPGAGFIKQTLSDLPAGNYKLSAYFASQAGDIFILNAGSTYKKVLASDNNETLVETYFTLASTSDVEISGTCNASWYEADNFHLTYNPSLPASLTEVSGKMKTSVSTAQTSAVNAYNTNNTFANMLSAQTAMNNAVESKAEYNKISTIRSAYATKAGALDTDGQTAYDTAKSAASTGAETMYTEGAYTTADEAETAYGRDYITAVKAQTTNNTDMTEAIVNPSFETGNMTGWTNSGFAIKNNDGFADRSGTYFVDQWHVSGDKSIKQTLSGLHQGKYRLTAAAVANADATSTKLYVKVGETETPTTVSTTSGDYIVNFNYDGSSTLEIGFSTTLGNDGWAAVDNFRLTYLETYYATDTDYAALSAAITSAEARTLGFEDGEYAPYNNITILTKLANAKAIRDESPRTNRLRTDIQTLTSDLESDGSWTANVGSVDAIYNGNMAVADGHNPKGWSRPNSEWGQHQNNTSGYDWTNVSSNKTAWYYNNNLSSYYGNVGNYTMPLKANTMYEFKVKYCSQGDNGGGLITSYKATIQKGEETPVMNQYELGSNTTKKFEEKKVYFTTTDAGNYVLTLANTGNFFFTDVSITKVADQTLTLPSETPYAAGTYPEVALDRTFANTSNWYTLCAPFDFPKSAFAEVKVLDRVTDNAGDVNMTFTDAGSTISAGTPCLVKPASADATLSVEDVAIDPATSAGSTVESDGTTTVTYVGKFENTVMNGSTVTNAWVVSNNALYHVAEGHNATVGAYRAYFTVSASGDVKALSYDFGDAVGINAIDNGQLTIDNDKVIYNLAGQKMNKLQRGVNIVNGKKVLVK